MLDAIWFVLEIAGFDPGPSDGRDCGRAKVLNTIRGIGIVVVSGFCAIVIYYNHFG